MAARWSPPTSAAWKAACAYSDQLGLGAIAGDEIWERQSRARIKLGPLTARQYLSFLPAGDAWEPLRAITTFFTGGEIEFEVQLVLKREEVPPCELRGGRRNGAASGLVQLDQVRACLRRATRAIRFCC